LTEGWKLITCPHCGSQSPDWAEFCHRCGGYFSEGKDSTLPPIEACPNCGTVRLDSARFCYDCGHSFGTEIRPNPTTAKLLAVLPGFLYIYGLGHIYLKRYVLGIALLAISAVNMLLIMMLGDQEILKWVILLADLGIFVWQTSDVYRIVRQQRH
jgi:uncharacterized membrane protein YvbJ